MYLNTKDLEQQQTTVYGPATVENSTLEKPFSSASTSPKLLRRVENLHLLDLVAIPETVRIVGNGNVEVHVRCLKCQKVSRKWLHNLEHQKGVRCACARKPNPVMRLLSWRYQSMKQRCETDTHVASHNYKGRGIQLLFRNKAHFIMWALTKYPNEDFLGKDFDRINNDGHYEPSNLRLVSRRQNLANTRNSLGSPLAWAKLFLHRNRHVTFCATTVRNLYKQGMDEAQILEHFKNGGEQRVASLGDQVAEIEIRALDFIAANPEMKFGEEETIRLMRGHKTEAEILALWNVSTLNPNRDKSFSLQHARDLSAKHPEVKYSVSGIYKLVRSGLSEEQVLAKWASSQSNGVNMSERVRQFMTTNPGLYVSESGARKLFTKGMTEAQVIAQCSIEPGVVRRKRLMSAHPEFQIAEVTMQRWLREQPGITDAQILDRVKRS